MNFLFICGSAEPGKDGVGDYTRRLCGSLIRLGHKAELLSLCDHNVVGFVKQAQVIEKTSVIVRRIAIDTSKRQRLIWMQESVKEVAPDWISLQFVAYGFNSKGLPFWLTGFLIQLRGNYKWQFMFHELWVGRSKKDSSKSKIVSYLQQIIIKKLLRVIRPEVIHTQLPIFSDNLKTMGFIAQALPLFSNVIEYEQIRIKPKTSYRIGFFSQVNTSTEITQFINEICKVFSQKAIEVELVIIGGLKGNMQKQLDIFKVLCPGLSNSFCTGFLNNEEVSYAIQQCDLGITPIPSHALGKSGSTVAFLAHGIPVAAPVIQEEYLKSGIGFFDTKQIDAIVTRPELIAIEIAKKASLVLKKELEISKISITFLNNLTQN